MADPSSDTQNEDGDGEAEARHVERSFTCTVCGYPTTHTAGRLQGEVRATCLNCGDWTVQTADVDALIDTSRDLAERISGAVLTERQALAYLLREVVGVDRREAAAAMDTTASNVDNLHRRAREKVADARRVVDELRILKSETEN
ncbi:MAG: sigma-70 region 4 domain-containing protein [Halobacteriales archaeon]